MDGSKDNGVHKEGAVIGDKEGPKPWTKQRGPFGEGDLTPHVIQG